MRDLKIYAMEDGGVDIDILEGEATYVDRSTQTNDQRAALSVYTVKGTVPGAPDYGVSWAEQYTNNNTVAQLSNEMNMQLQQYAGTSSEASMATNTQYSANVLTYNGEVGVIVMRG